MVLVRIVTDCLDLQFYVVSKKAGTLFVGVMLKDSTSEGNIDMAETFKELGLKMTVIV